MLLESELLLVVERVLRGRDRDQREVRRESVRRDGRLGDPTATAFVAEVPPLVPVVRSEGR